MKFDKLGIYEIQLRIYFRIPCYWRNYLELRIRLKIDKYGNGTGITLLLALWHYIWASYGNDG